MTTSLPGGSSAKILVVEDQMIIAMFLTDLLDDLGFSVLGLACNGAEASRLAEQEQPDVAMVDISLAAERDGVEIARDLVDRFGTKIIFMSGHDGVAEWPEVMALSPVAVLNKPCLPAQIEAALHQAVSTAVSV
uniref:response regulator n=1 Tax=Pararhizobium sp. IMCC3301 TaxID=3067904 RepID=UPI002740A55C|nr:response regulator [Pararhizobium sp. IMCC3301]